MAKTNTNHATRNMADSLAVSAKVELAIQAPGIEDAIVPEIELPDKADARFRKMAEEGKGRYKQEDSTLLAATAVLEIKLEEAILEDDMETFINLNRQLRDNKKLLAASPVRRFDEASRQRGAAQYKMNDNSTRSPEAAVYAELTK